MMRPDPLVAGFVPRRSEVDNVPLPPLPREVLHAAAVTVAEHAHDVGEVHLFLQQLGLDEWGAA